jgi:hypothetical protein
MFCGILFLTPTTKGRFMPIFRSILIFAANRVASDPETRAKVAKVVDREIKPRAKAAWQQTQPAVSKIIAGLERFAGEPNPNDVAQPARKNSRESSDAAAFKLDLAKKVGAGRLWLWK